MLINCFAQKQIDDMWNYLIIFNPSDHLKWPIL